MTETIVQFFNSVTHNDYLTLFFISVIPIIELRGAIVIMSGMTGINEVAGMFCCVAGSTVIILPLILLIRPLIRSLKSSKFFRRLGASLEKDIDYKTQKVENDAKQGKTKRRSRKGFSAETKRFWALFTFVGVPLPFTGAWSGSCVGSFLGLPVYKAALAVFLGNLAAAGFYTLIAMLIPAQYVDYLLYGFLLLVIALAAVGVFAKMKRKKKSMQL